MSRAGLEPENRDDDTSSLLSPLSDPSVFPRYRRRWWMLSLLSIAQCVSAILWISLAPIQSIAERYYQTSSLYINAFSLLYMALGIFLAFHAAMCIDSYGMRITMLVGVMLNGVGSWIRYIPDVTVANVWIALSGQLFCASAQPFLMASPPKLAAVWFPMNERTIATSIGSLANVLGIAAGYVMSPLIVTSEDQISLLNLICAGMSSAVCVGTFLSFQDHPPVSPSRSQDVARESGLRAWKDVFGNRNFLLLFASFGIGLGCFNALLTLLGQIMSADQLGYSETQCGIMGGVLIVAGLIGSGVIGCVVDRSHAYKSAMIFSLLGCSTSLCIFNIFLSPDRVILVYILLGALGFFALALLPISMETAVEVTFPCPEGIPSSMLLLCGQVTGIICVVVMSLIQENYSYSAAPLWFMLGLVLVGFICLFFMTPDYRRLRHEYSQVIRDVEVHREKKVIIPDSYGSFPPINLVAS